MSAPPTKNDALDFPPEIRSRYRVRRERLGPGEYDVTIPLRGKRGFVYLYGSGWFGVWLNHHRPNAAIDKLRQDFPRLIVQQVGMGECTFRVPESDLRRTLDRLGARVRAQPKLSDEERQRRLELVRALSLRLVRFGVPSQADGHARGILVRRAGDRPDHQDPERREDS